MDALAEYRRLAWWTMLAGLVMTAVLALSSYASVQPGSNAAIWIGVAITVVGGVWAVVTTVAMTHRRLR